MTCGMKERSLTKTPCSPSKFNKPNRPCTPLTRISWSISVPLAISKCNPLPLYMDGEWLGGKSQLIFFAAAVIRINVSFRTSLPTSQIFVNVISKPVYCLRHWLFPWLPSFLLRGFFRFLLHALISALDKCFTFTGVLKGRCDVTYQKKQIKPL